MGRHRILTHGEHRGESVGVDTSSIIGVAAGKTVVATVTIPSEESRDDVTRSSRAVT